MILALDYWAKFTILAIHTYASARLQRQHFAVLQILSGDRAFTMIGGLGCKMSSLSTRFDMSRHRPVRAFSMTFDTLSVTLSTTSNGDMKDIGIAFMNFYSKRLFYYYFHTYMIKNKARHYVISSCLKNTALRMNIY